MSKHPLLPDSYHDVAIQSAILFALSPYKLEVRTGIVNPRLIWDLTQAWNDAEGFLAKSIWHQRENGSEYELWADTAREIERLNTIIAGLLAHQMTHADSAVSVRRIDHRKGGEVAIIISASVADALHQIFPLSRYIKVRHSGV